ncbi:MAG: hypothetical protein ACYDH6_10505 [Acidimicrobiales bacterium]
MSAYWLKPEDRVRPEWFTPLEDLATTVAADPTLPRVDPDHFLYAARIERSGFAVLHAYRHIGSRKFLNVDEHGEVWRYTGSDKVGSGRYAPYPSLDEALDALELFRGNLIVGHLRSSAQAGGQVVAEEVGRLAEEPVAV